MKRSFEFGPGTDLDDLNEQIKRMTNNYAPGFSYTVDRINNILVVDDGAPVVVAEPCKLPKDPRHCSRNGGDYVCSVCLPLAH